MRWPWSRRPRNLPLARHRAAWAEPAAPPCQDETAKPTLAGADKVRLGFADGSDLELADSDPRAKALKAVADVLLRQEPVRARE